MFGSIVERAKVSVVPVASVAAASVRALAESSRPARNIRSLSSIVSSPSASVRSVCRSASVMPPGASCCAFCANASGTSLSSVNWIWSSAGPGLFLTIARDTAALPAACWSWRIGCSAIAPRRRHRGGSGALERVRAGPVTGASLPHACHIVSRVTSRACASRRLRRRCRGLRARPARLVGRGDRPRGSTTGPHARVSDRGPRGGHGQAHPRAGGPASPTVTAVEPLDGMRAVLSRVAPAAHAFPGTAESIPLPDGAVDAVFVAEAFHWFDPRPGRRRDRARPAPRRGRGDPLQPRATHMPRRWSGSASPTRSSRHTGSRPTTSIRTTRRRGGRRWPPASAPLPRGLRRDRAAHGPRRDRGGPYASFSGIAGLPPGRREAALAAIRDVLARHDVGQVEIGLTTTIVTGAPRARR